MAWKLLPVPNKAELSALERESKKPRFLVDADLGPTFAGWLNEMSCNAKTPQDFGYLASATDEELFALAWKEQRILITCDADFLNDTRFPEHRNPGIIVLPNVSRQSIEFARAVFVAKNVLAPLKQLTFKSKIEIKTGGEFSLTYRDSASGRIIRARHKLERGDNVYEWSD